MLYLSNIIPKPNARYTHSCGCKRSQLVTKKNTVHGLSSSKFYTHWRSMKCRMLPSYIDAKYYVGISICDRWLEFNNFKTDMYDSWLKHESAYGGNNTTLERKNWTDNYTPENCVWATQIEQQNNKRNTIYVSYKGEKHTLKNVCKSLNINYYTVRQRFMRGYTVDEALSNELWVRQYKHQAKYKELINADL